MDELEFIDNLFNTLDDNTDNAILSLNNAANKISKEILSEVNDTISVLKKDASGNIVASIENIKKVNELSVSLEKYLSSSEYQQAMGVFLGSYSSNVILINSYFNAISTSFTASDILYKQIASAAKGSTIESLMGSGISANVKDPLIKILNDSIMTGTNRNEVYDLLKKEILGDEQNLGRLQKYVKQISNDAITQFNSNYIQIIGNDLGLSHYYYKGTRVSETREFCDTYAGKFFTEEKLQQIVIQQSQSHAGKGWTGMINGTSWPNFKIYRGGWNCRHYVIPISKAVYDSKADRQA